MKVVVTRGYFPIDISFIMVISHCWYLMPNLWKSRSFIVHVNHDDFL